MRPQAETVHASCVVLGEAGILIRGPSGSGKSSVARELVERRTAIGGFAALVADDRVRIERLGERLVARPVPVIAGRLEIRGLGIVMVPHEPAAVMRLVVDLEEPSARLPGAAALRTSILDVDLLRLVAAAAIAPNLVAWRIRGLDDTLVTER